jgi:uncharacterized protein
MLVVLDTNIFLSALISPHGIADMIYQAWRSARFEIITSVFQLEELKRTTRYPKFQTILQPHRVGTMVNNLQRAIILDNLPHSDVVLNDPEDEFLVSMAVEGHADYLVTGDRRAGLLKMQNIGRTKIVTPSKFCTEILLGNKP